MPYNSGGGRQAKQRVEPRIVNNRMAVLLLNNRWLAGWLVGWWKLDNRIDYLCVLYLLMCT